MAKQPLPTPAQIRQLIRYDPKTGKLFWRERDSSWFPDSQNFGDAQRSWNTQFSGREITSRNSAGYIRLRFRNKTLAAHRVAWCIMTGEWPTYEIDHINGVKDDNRFCNLRDVTGSTNMKNLSKRTDNRSGITGVAWHAASAKWRAIVTHNRRQIQLGVFTDKESAAIAVKAARKVLGFTNRHGC